MDGKGKKGCEAGKGTGMERRGADERRGDFRG